jgi:hypothetical protein
MTDNPAGEIIYDHDVVIQPKTGILGVTQNQPVANQEDEEQAE